MFSITEEHGSQIDGTLETMGEFESLEHCLGIFESRHTQRGYLFSAAIRITFRGDDELACAGFNDPDLGQALGFRGNVAVRWEDICHKSFDRAVIISYDSEMLAEECDLADVRRDALLDLGAINVWLKRAI